VKPYRFRALITSRLTAGDGAAHGLLGGTHACCLVQPRHGSFFPAVISPDQELTTRAAWSAVVSITVAGGEAEAFFAPGQRFTIWADAVVGDTIQARGLAGHGITGYPISLPASRAQNDGAAGRSRAPPVGAARQRSESLPHMARASA
jgi:hypothetical protein